MTTPTDEEVRRLAQEWGVSEAEARFILAIESGELKGDVAIADAHPEGDDE